MNKVLKNYLLPIGLLSGTIIGAGVFALPFVFNASGLTWGIIFLTLAALVYVFLHLMYADVIIRTPGEHRFVGYTKTYLGEIPSWMSIWITVVEMIFVLTIYLVISASFANLLISFGSDLEKILIFWFLGSVAIFLTLKRIAFLEFLITFGIVAIIFIIFILGFKNFLGLSLFGLPGNFYQALLPLPPLLFALSGRVAIPSVINYFKGQPDSPRLIKKTIIFGTILPAVIYTLFVFGVLGLSLNVTEDAVSGLINQVPAAVLLLVGVLGIISLFSSYIIVGLDVNSILRYDLKFSRLFRFLAVVLGPLILYFSGFKQFLVLVSFVGGIFLVFEGFFIISMWLKANKTLTEPPILLKRNWIIIGALILTLAIALVYEIMK
jgi:amino acid permease